MFCPKCGTALPDGAAFCLRCGAPIPGAAPGGGSPGGASPPAAAAAGSSPAPTGPQSLKCPSCGGPLHPEFGEMVITCDYCGSSVTLGGNGWKEINKHTMLPLKIADAAAALAVVRAHVDAGFFHRKDFEESKVGDPTLRFVPFWIVPTSASTTYQYQAVATTVGATVGTIAAAELLGSALGGERGGGGFVAMPILAGPVVNPTRSETISGQFEYPVIAVKSMNAYQPKDYAFGLGDRTFFDKKAIPGGTPVLNGDVGEDAAQHAAKAFVEQLQSETAHKKHHMVSKLQTSVELSEGELLHAPVWTFVLERKGQRTTVLVDAHQGRVIQTF